MFLLVYVSMTLKRQFIIQICLPSRVDISSFRNETKKQLFKISYILHEQADSQPISGDFAVSALILRRIHVEFQCYANRNRANRAIKGLLG